MLLRVRNGIETNLGVGVDLASHHGDSGDDVDGAEDEEGVGDVVDGPYADDGVDAPYAVEVVAVDDDTAAQLRAVEDAEWVEMEVLLVEIRPLNISTF